MALSVSKLQLLACTMPIVIFAITIVLLIVLVLLFFTPFHYIPVFYMAWFIYDHYIAKTPWRGGRQQFASFFRKHYLWRLLAAYFPVRLHKTAELDSKINYIFTGHPHGYFEHGTVCSFLTDAAGAAELFPNITRHLLTRDLFFHLPILREIMMFFGMSSVSRESILYKLTQLGQGQAVYLEPGGRKEVALAAFAPDYYLNILNRKGFIRAALDTGAQVVPVFKFGEHHIFEPTNTPTKASIRWFINFSEKVAGVKIPPIRGAFGVLVPLPRPINHVVGAPLCFDKTALESSCSSIEEMVDLCHKQYLDALRNLFEENKVRFGDADHKLVFI